MRWAAIYSAPKIYVVFVFFGRPRGSLLELFGGLRAHLVVLAFLFDAQAAQIRVGVLSYFVTK